MFQPNEVVSEIKGSVVATWRPLSTSYVHWAGKQLEHAFPIAGVAVSGDTIVTVSDQIRVWQHGVIVAELNPLTDEQEVCCPFTAVEFSFDVFGVTDIHGNCSIWDAHSYTLIEMYNLSDRIMYGLAFANTKSVVFACVDETGALFVVDRASQQVTCAESPEVVHPACQPTVISWLGTSILIGFQTSGTILVYELGSTAQAAANGPELISSVRTGNCLSGFVWLESNLFVTAHDNGSIAAWRIGKKLVQTVWNCQVEEGASAVGVVDGTLCVGTANGKLIQLEFDRDLLCGEAAKEFNRKVQLPDNHRRAYPALS